MYGGDERVMVKHFPRNSTAWGSLEDALEVFGLWFQIP